GKAADGRGGWACGAGRGGGAGAGAGAGTTTRGDGGGGGEALNGITGVGALPKFTAGVARGVNSSAACAPSLDTVITPPQTAQRARTIARGIFAGSTRKTERHSGQATFTAPPFRRMRRRAPRCARTRPQACPCVDR